MAIESTNIYLSVTTFSYIFNSQERNEEILFLKYLIVKKNSSQIELLSTQAKRFVP